YIADHSATRELYTLSLHDALPIFEKEQVFHLTLENATLDGRTDRNNLVRIDALVAFPSEQILYQLLDAGHTSLSDNQHDFVDLVDRKSTRLNSSHRTISYAVFCLK